MNTRVSMFANAYSDQPKDAGLNAVLGAIRNGHYSARIQRARELFAAWKAACPALDSKAFPEAEEYDTFKKSLPAFCVSGTAKGRKEPLLHSGLLQVDCDKLNGALEPLREKLKADKHIAFGFVSPSGDGLKLGLAIDGSRHSESFEAAQRYFREEYAVEIDPKVKDRLRLCFVSHDPALWTNPDATPLPVPEMEMEMAMEIEAPVEAPAGLEAAESSPALNVLVLPSGEVSISQSAREIFQRIAPSGELFWRGGAIVEMVEHDGLANLDLVVPEAFRSRVERHGDLFAWRCGPEGKAALKRVTMPRDTAAALMTSAEARELLPPVSNVLRCPVLVDAGDGKVTVLGRGYHPELGGLLIVAGEAPPRVPLREAVASLKALIEEFDFQSEGDRSRALAAFMTPALRIGGFLNGDMEHLPIDVAEADQSQSGKGYRHNLVCALYNESAYFITARGGGVGSTDESFAAALITGRPFICLDNFRGKLDSQHLEAFLTCPRLFPARIPHRGEVMVNPKRFMLQMSSNGMEATRDLANRASICRIRKRPDFNYRDTFGEIQKRQSYYLGCVFAVIIEWIAEGKPKSKDTRHSFREWNQTLDWIVQGIFGGAPLMDGHEGAQRRVCDPALSFLRALALVVEREGKLGEAMIASEIVEMCQVEALDVPGWRDNDEDQGKRQVGLVMRRVFKTGDEIEVDGFKAHRSRREYRKPSGDMALTPEYTFTK